MNNLWSGWVIPSNTGSNYTPQGRCKEAAAKTIATKQNSKECHFPILNSEHVKSKCLPGCDSAGTLEVEIQEKQLDTTITGPFNANSVLIDS
jgi:hypothetical protein